MIKFNRELDCYELYIKRRSGKIEISLFDKQDLLLIKMHRWSIGSRGYLENPRIGKFHKILLDTKNGKLSDHINRNKLDNRRCNLRIVDRSQNCINSKVRKHSSKYKNVWKFGENRKKPFGVRVCDKYIGSFKTEEEAAKVANYWMKRLQGKYANLNEIGTHNVKL